MYVTPFEHNAVTRPLHQLEKTLDATITVLSFREDTLTADLEGIAQQFDAEKPDLVVMTHASNVIGTIAPVLEIATIAKKYGAITVIDMSQTAGLVPIDLATNLIDYAVFAGHKALMGPFGVGGFACLDSASLKPVLFGGNGINSLEQDMPDDIVAMSEVGSQNTYAIAGLYASTKWIIEKGIDTLQSQEQANRDQLLRLLDGYPNIRIIGNADGGAYTGVVSAVFDRYSPDEIEMVLNKCHVAVRSGLHCSPYAHRFLGTLPAGTVRFSVSPLTTENEFLTLDNALRLIEES